MGGQPPQWREEFRRQQQAEHAGAQRGQAVQIEHAQIAQAEVQGHDRHAHRGKELQHGGGQKRDAQHFQRTLAHALGRGANAAQFGLPAAIHAQQAQTLEPVSEVPAHAGHLAQLLAAGRFGAPAHQHHEERNQRCGQQQYQAHHPIDGEHRDQDQRRHQPHFGPRQLVADKIAFQRIGVRQAQLAQLAAALPAQPHRPVLHQAASDAGAQFPLGDIGHLAGQRLRPGRQQRTAEHRQQQASTRLAQLRQCQMLHQYRLQQPGNGPRLCQQQHTRQRYCHAGQPALTGGRDGERVQPLAALSALGGRVAGSCAGLAHIAFRKLLDSAIVMVSSPGRDGHFAALSPSRIDLDQRAGRGKRR